MKSKKAQAAMEFIMTYGWAILVVIGAIGALAYFGVLTPNKFLPEKCTLPAGLACLDSISSSSGITMVIQNSAGIDMSNVAVSVAGTGCTAGATGSTTLNNGDKQTYTISCALTTGAQYKGSVTVAYTNINTGLQHNATGEIVTVV